MTNELEVTTKGKAMTTVTTRNPLGAGRKPLLTPEVATEFFGARSMGLSIERSAKWAGVSLSAVKNWKVRGEAALLLSVDKRDAMDQKCARFVTALDKIDQEWIRRCELVLKLTMAPGDSEAAWAVATQAERSEATATAKWKLQHQAPSEYSTQSRTELTGADGGPIQVDPTGMDVFKTMLEVQAYDDEQEAVALEERNY